MPEELVDEVDRSGNFVATRPRSHLKERVFFHKASLIIPITANNKILISRRAANKHPYPGTWCCAVGGGVSSGESDEAAATREMKEEIGKVYPLRKLATFVYDQPTDKKIFSLFTTAVPALPEDLTLDPREVQYVKGFPVGEVAEMIDESPEKFAPTFIAAFRQFIKHHPK